MGAGGGAWGAAGQWERGAGPEGAERGRHGAADDPEENAREGARAAAARAGIGQRREDDAAEAAERGERGRHLPHAGLQHPHAAAPRVPAAHLGRGRAELPPLLLAQLLREHGRAALGGGQQRQAEAESVCPGAQDTAQRGAPGRGHPAGVRQQAGPARGAAGRGHPPGPGAGLHPQPPLAPAGLLGLHRPRPSCPAWTGCWTTWGARLCPPD